MPLTRCAATLLLVSSFALGARGEEGVASAPVPSPAAPSKVPEKPAPAAPEVRIASEKELVAEDDYELRLSLPTETDREAWREPGLSVQLAYGQGWWWGAKPALDFTTDAFTVRTRVRLDRWWSAAATFSYQLGGGDFAGLRWAAAVEPAFHPLPDVAIALGLGYAGLMGNATKLPEVGPPIDRDVEYASRELGPDEAPWDCTGGGLVAHARVDWVFAMGPLFAMGPYADAGMQWTRCTSSLGGTDGETGLPIVGSQWWRHAGATLGWWLAWR